MTPLEPFSPAHAVIDLEPAASTSRATAHTLRAANVRNVALDFTKGALVLCMIVYHSLNYFYHDKDLLKFLHFLPPSFIFIAGFLVTNVQQGKLQVDGGSVQRRLFVRGLKLLGIFVGLNLVVHALFSASYNHRQFGLGVFVRNLDSIFLTGGERAAVFEVLLPIAYLLLLSGPLLRVAHCSRALLVALCVATVGSALAIAAAHELVFNLDLLSMGLLGMAVGLIPISRIERVTTRLGLLVAAYAGYAAWVSVQYPTFAINILGVCLTLALIYAIGQKLPAGSFASAVFARWGKYSLAAYIAQIAVLQVLFRVFRAAGLREGAIAWAFAITVVAIGVGIEIVDRLRRRAPRVNRVYQAVFA